MKKQRKDIDAVFMPVKRVNFTIDETAVAEGGTGRERLKIIGMHAIQQCIDIIDMSLIIVNSQTCSSIIGHGIDIKKY